MTRARGFVLVLAVLLALPACISLKRSKDAQVFVLEPLAARGAASPDPDPAPATVIGVLPVEVPGWLDRPQIVARGASSQVQVDDFSRWGEPIARGVQRVVAENLAALLPDRRVVSAPWAGYTSVVERVQVNVGELARQADGSVLLEARWALIGPDRSTLLQRRSSYREASSTSVSDTVEASSRVLAELCREIATALAALPPPQAEDPPAR